jgi:hypothetical protein
MNDAANRGFSIGELAAEHLLGGSPRGRHSTDISAGGGAPAQAFASWWAFLRRAVQER